MQTNGRVLDVSLENVGTTLYDAAVVTATEINIVSAGDLDDEGGQIEILGNVYDYSGIVEYENYDTITIDPPLVADAEVGDEVDLYPVVQQKVAVVRQDDQSVDWQYDSNNDFEAYIAPGLADTFDIGDRDDTLGEYVQIDNESGQWIVIKVYGREGKVRAESIDGHLPIETMSDGVPPDASPTPTLEVFAIGALRWRVDPTTAPNPDPVRYRVYADIVDPPTIDAAHLVYDGGSITGSFATINGTPILPADPTLLPVSHYVRVIQYDADGDGPESATSNLAAPKRADIDTIAANWVYAGEIQANQITAGELMADYVLAGKITAAGGLMQVADDGSITIFSATTGNPLVQLSPNGSVFRGRVEADDVSILNGLVLQGVLSHIAPNALLTIDDTIADPGSAPSVTSIVPTVQPLPQPPTGYIVYGLAWDDVDNCWIRFITGNPNIRKVERISTAGVVTSTLTLTGSPTNEEHYSILRMGSYYYTTVSDYEGDGTWTVDVLKWNATTGAYVDRGGGVYFAHAQDVRSAIGTDGTYILMANSSFGGSIHLIDPTDLSNDGRWDLPADVAPTAKMWVGRGNFDFGADRVVLATNTTVYVYTISGSILTLVSAETWNSYAARGFCWGDDLGAFVSNNGGSNLYRHGTYYPAASEKAYVAYEDTDGTDHTASSPIASITLQKRQELSITLPPAPSAAAIPKVYALLGTSTPAVTSLLERPESIASRSLQMNPDTAGGSALVDTNTFAGAGTPGKIVSSEGGLELHGSGLARLPGLELYSVRGQRIGAQAAAYNVATKIAFDTWSGSSQNGAFWTWNGTNREFTIQEDGLYLAAANIQWESDATGLRRLRIFAGSWLAASTDSEPTTTALYQNVNTGFVWLTAGQVVYVEAYELTNPNVSLDIDSAATWISLTRIAGEFAA